MVCSRSNRATQVPKAKEDKVECRTMESSKASNAVGLLRLRIKIYEKHQNRDKLCASDREYL